MRLIDADELRKCAIPCEIHNGALTDLCVPLYQIDNAPTIIWCSETPDGLPLIDLRPRPQGEWIDTGSGQQCSICNEIQYGYDNFRNFCPFCGADMRKETCNETN